MEGLANHPKQRLLFYMPGSQESECIEQLRSLVHRMAVQKSWTIAPPTFVDEVEAPDNPTDDPVRTVGGFIEVYSALPPWRDRLPQDIDESNFSDCEFLIDQLRLFSQEHSCQFEFELDGVYVGQIADGMLDKLLADGFLGEWRKALTHQ